MSATCAALGSVLKMRAHQPRSLTHSDALRTATPRGATTRARLPAGVVLVGGFLSGAIPFSNIAARLTRGVDLREVGTGTVSGTSLHRVAGFGPLAAAGVLEVAKGAVGPALAGRDRPLLAAAAAGAAVAGHNWSPFLRGAGGRGISPATGALLVQAPTGAGVLLGGMAGGRLLHQTALGSFVADLVVVPVSRRMHGWPGSARGCVRGRGDARQAARGERAGVPRAVVGRDAQPPSVRPRSRRQPIAPLIRGVGSEVMAAATASGDTSVPLIEQTIGDNLAETASAVRGQRCIDRSLSRCPPDVRAARRRGRSTGSWSARRGTRQG